jgi:molybdenum cofactor cytidylyltransferase
MNGLWAIILAAGESKRMGSPKMLLPFNNKTMLETVIGNVTGSEIDNVLVVLGSGRDKLTELVEKCNVRHCYNDNYKSGMLSSVKCGFKNLPSELEAVLVFQGDQPLISPEVINMVISAYRSSDKGIVIPAFKSKRGHPLLIDQKYRDEIEKLDDSKGLRSLSLNYPDDVLQFETDSEGVLRDFDTWEEYKKETTQII